MREPAFLQAAAALLVPARLLIGLWLLLAIAHRWAARRSPAPWGPGSALSPALLRPLFGAQAALGLVAMASGSAMVLVVCLALLLVSQGALLFVTGAFWADGSEKMGMIAMAGTLLIATGVAARDPGLALAGALLAGGQVALCYATAGLSKLPVPGWRDGRELAAVMASRGFGHPAAARMLARRRSVAMLASWAVIVAEAAFPLAMLAPQPLLLAALAVLLAFHVATAVLMGLATFPWAFAAAYPATLLLGRAIRGLLA